MPKFSEFLFGKKDKIKKADLQSKEQQDMMKMIKQALTKGEGPLADIYGNFNADEFQKGVADPAMKNFRENILPQLQEKFIAGNQLMGSGMIRGQNKAATDLQSELAGLLYNAQQQQRQNKMAGVNALMGKQTHENIYQQGGTGAAQEAVKAGTKAVAAYATGGTSAAAAPIA